jgi:hypothetical protein
MFFCSERRFGVEIEYNAIDGSSKSSDIDGLPCGIYMFADVVKDAINKNVEVNKWHSTNNNKNWIVKPDSSCGLEICSPPNYSLEGIKEVENVIDGISNKKHFESDSRCSLHVHVEIDDFNYSQILFLIQSWIQYEPVFFLMARKDRLFNNYCKPISFCFDFFLNDLRNSSLIYESICENKYFAINLCSYKKKKKKTIEFRIMGSDGCISSSVCSAWCKILLSFVSSCKKKCDIVHFMNDINYKSISQFEKFIEIDTNFPNFDFKKWLCDRIKIVDTFAKNKSVNILWEKIFNIYKFEFDKLNWREND